MATVHPTSEPVTAANPLFSDDAVRMALTRSRADRVVGLALVLVGWAGAAWMQFGKVDVQQADVRQGAVFSLLVGPALLAIGASFLVKSLRLGRERAWLAALPFPFAHEGYLRALGSASEGGAELVLRFASPPEAGVVEALAASFGVRAKGEEAGTVRVEAPAGQALHPWFRRRAAPLLVKLRAEHGLDAVEIAA